MKKISFTPLQALVHLSAWGLAAYLAWAFFTGALTANPIQALEQHTGKYALTFLVLSLACTPANTLLGFRQALTARRALGLYAFFFALVHFAIFIGLDYQLDWGLLQGAIFEKRFVIVGLAALLLLLPLAITSTKGWKKRLGKRWKRLHQAVYLIAGLVLLHYAWAMKGDIFRLEGNIIQPLLYALAVALLLALRIPAVRQAAVRLRSRQQQLRRGHFKIEQSGQ